MIMDVIVGIAQMVVVAAALFALVMGLGWLVEEVWERWNSYRQARRDRIEAELDAAAEELHRTIVSLAEALAEERVAAVLAQRDMTHAAQQVSAISVMKTEA